MEAGILERNLSLWFDDPKVGFLTQTPIPTRLTIRH